MAQPHAAAYAKLPTREQQQEMSSMQRTGESRFMLQPPPDNHARIHSHNSSNSMDNSTNESLSSASVPDSSSVDVHDEETGDGSASLSAADGPQGEGEGETATVAGLIVLDARAPGPGEATITLMRLGGTGLGNVQLNVPLNWRVGQLLQRVYAREINEEHARVRVVFMGRMLANDEALGAAGVAHGCILHTHVMAGMGPPDSMQQQNQQQNQPPQLIDDQGNPVPQGEVLIADEDAAAIAAAEGLYPGQYTPAQLALMRRAQLEHAQEQHHNSFAPREGTTGDFVLGFLLGLILGAIAVIWLYSPTLTRKQRLGIMMGLLFNIGMMLWNSLHPDKTDGALDGTGVIPDPSQPGGGISNG